MTATITITIQIDNPCADCGATHDDWGHMRAPALVEGTEIVAWPAPGTCDACHNERSAQVRVDWDRACRDRVAAQYWYLPGY